MLKHAGPGTASRVTVIVTDPGTLLAQAMNDRPPRHRPILPSSGHGLAGMPELVELLGGRLTAGPTANAGWSVTVELPEGVAR